MTETLGFLDRHESAEAVRATVSLENMPAKRRGRPPGVPNKIARFGKEIINEAAPWDLLIRVMEGRTFRRAEKAGARRSAPVRPTLEQSIAAAEILMRKVIPDLKSNELTGANGGPIESRSTNVHINGTRLAEAVAAVLSQHARLPRL
jgi:hypothetical protein